MLTTPSPQRFLSNVEVDGTFSVGGRLTMPVQSTTVLVTHDDILSLGNATFQIVPAPRSGLITLPLYFVARMHTTDGAYTFSGNTNPLTFSIATDTQFGAAEIPYNFGFFMDQALDDQVERAEPASFGGLLSHWQGAMMLGLIDQGALYTGVISDGDPNNYLTVLAVYTTIGI
jgi:hypothetical protein